jgi:translation initiation factor eIF-2B subunit delta
LVMSSNPQPQHKHHRAPSLSLQTNGPGQNDTPAGAAQKSQKQMTKAERREMQERQRAAKAAKVAAPGPQTGGSQAKPTHPAPSASSHPKKTGKESPVQTRGPLVAGPSGLPNKSAKESKAAAAEEAAGRSRGLRIFSHFALQKSAGHVPKGDVHPAIVRLGLMFAEFKICGANARCIATLSVFKRVRALPVIAWLVKLTSMSGRSYKTTQLHRITRCHDTS